MPPRATNDDHTVIQPINSSSPMGEPFPLKTRFRRRFVPALLAFVGISLLIIGLTALHTVEAIYLELAQQRAQTIERSVAGSDQTAWTEIMAGRSPAETLQTKDASILTAAFEREVREQNLQELKVYDLNRTVLYATNAEEIGTREQGNALREVIAEAESGIVTKTLPDGSQQYELYVPVFDDSGSLRAVFELYEPVGYLDAIYAKSALPIVSTLGLLFLLLGLALDRLVGKAQSDIDARTKLIDELRLRLESFVSSTAVNAALEAAGDDSIHSKRITTTLFFSDVRDFTGFSERRAPEEVVDFLNDIMTLQVNILTRHGGDVDKMIGDAILARFDSDDGSRRAIAAAREIQAIATKDRLPRLLGIGIYKGEVISGTIGPKDRRDFTVIGDAVNVTARLCSAAKAGEIVVEAGLADGGFEAQETISVKGRVTPLAIRRDHNAISAQS